MIYMSNFIKGYYHNIEKMTRQIFGPIIRSKRPKSEIGAKPDPWWAKPRSGESPPPQFDENEKQHQITGVFVFVLCVEKF